jgi:PPM family protein phosphatase
MQNNHASALHAKGKVHSTFIEVRDMEGNNEQANMRMAWMTDAGSKRDRNEDAVLVDSDQAIMILADGMGGHPAGGVASSIAAQEAFKFLQAHMHCTGTDEWERLLGAATLRAHALVKSHLASDKGPEDMGTTLLTAVVQGGCAFISNIGDSRAYIMGASLKQITSDHAVEDRFMGLLLMDEVFPPRRYRVLTQAVGASTTIQPDFFTRSLERGDILLLCSDGLTDMLSDEMIEGVVLRTRHDLNRTASELVSLANRRGGYDNISVALLEML